MTATNTQNTTAISSNNSSTPSSDLGNRIAIARQRVQEAEKWSRRANTATIALLILYVISTALAVGTTPLTIWASGRLRTAETILNELLREEAKTEQERIETEARTEITRVETESQEKVAALKLEAELARKEIIESQRELERERLTRLELERTLAPRMLASSGDAIRRLQRFAGTKYTLEFLSDPDADRLATRIAWVLSSSDWEQLPPLLHINTPVRDGITIEAKALDGRLPAPALELTEYLEANGLLVWTSNAESGRADWMAAGVVAISVGFKPNPYFEDKFADGTKQTTRLLDGITTPGLERNKRTPEDIERLRTKWNLPEAQ